MPKNVEIDEADLLAKNQVVGLVDLILKNPGARKQFHQAVKTVRPDTVIPEIDAKDEVMAALEIERQARLALEKQIADDKAKVEADAKTASFVAKWNGQKDKLRSEGWLDDGLAEVEKMAQERGIADLAAAAALYEKEHPPAEPVTPAAGIGSFDLFREQGEDKDMMKKLLESRGEDDSALSSLVNSALTDLRSGGRRRAA